MKKIKSTIEDTYANQIISNRSRENLHLRGIPRGDRCQRCDETVYCKCSKQTLEEIQTMLEGE